MFPTWHGAWGENHMARDVMGCVWAVVSLAVVATVFTTANLALVPKMRACIDRLTDTVDACRVVAYLGGGSVECELQSDLLHCALPRFALLNETFNVFRSNVGGLCAMESSSEKDRDDCKQGVVLFNIFYGLFGAPFTVSFIGAFMGLLLEFYEDRCYGEKDEQLPPLVVPLQPPGPDVLMEEGHGEAVPCEGVEGQ